jgi:ethanolamine ammonia-lyase small subunit
MNDPALPDPWQELRRLTPARIALGRAGVSLPTREVLAFGLAHAQARDAVHLPFDAERVLRQLRDHGFTARGVQSQAPERGVYLRRPDLGRRLAPDSAAALDAAPGKGADLVFMVGDGLSSTAIHAHALPFLLEARARLERRGLALGPAVVACQARVALGDEVGQRLQAACIAVLIGERPGLTAPDSMGLYLTWQPRIGRMDSERNCISNIRPQGLPCHEAAARLEWLVLEARRLHLTGVGLKEGSSAADGRSLP